MSNAKLTSSLISTLAQQIARRVCVLAQGGGLPTHKLDSMWACVAYNMQSIISLGGYETVHSSVIVSNQLGL